MIEIFSNQTITLAIGFLLLMGIIWALIASIFDLKTTEIYARADTETKRKAIEKFAPDLVDSNLPDWSNDDAVLS